MNFFHQYHTEPQIIHNRKICFEPHIHAEVEIIAVFKGSASLMANGVEYFVKEGDYIIIFPNIVHSYTLEKDIDVGKFIFSTTDMPDFNFIFETKLPKSPVISSESVAGTTLPSLTREILECYGASSPPVKKAYLLLLMGKLMELCSPEDKKLLNNTVLRVFEYCESNYRRRLTLEEVANALFVSKSCISHIFSCRLKMNFCNYINLLRINEAAFLLRTKNMSITEIAGCTGFGSIRTFNRAFVKIMGVTPKEYKKELLRKEKGA